MIAITLKATVEDGFMSVDIAVGDSEDLAVKAVRHFYAVIPAVWEFSENFYYLIMVLPPQMNHVRVADICTDQLNEFIEQNTPSISIAMIDDDDMNYLTKGELW